jgi:preprotein translocase subunit SecD
MLRFNRLNLSKLRRDFSSAQPLNKNVAQRFQEFSVAYKEMFVVISAIAITSASFSYIFEKFESHRKYTLVLEGKLLTLEKVTEEKLKTAEEKLRSQQEKLLSQEKITEEMLRSQQEKLLSQEKTMEEKLRAQENLARAQENLYEEKLKSLTGKSASPSSI